MVTLPSLETATPETPLWIAHRGAASLAPENTLEAYRAAWASGLRVLEQDVRVLADGTLVVMHDASVERTTTGSGPVGAMDLAMFRALRARPFRGFPSTVAPPVFADVLDEFKGRAVFVPEAKAPGSGAALVDALNAADIPVTQALVQAFALDDLFAAVAAGYPAMFLTRTGDGIDAARAAGVQWAGVDRRAPPAVFAAWREAGFRVVAYTVNDRAERDRLLALGVCGFFSDDPVSLMTD
ncbi:Glycerophosphoryl diester phosphodiesterase [Lysobacter dokdonensis DS-58]|uniref:Glycerophosphoryl diester phosphodiesterase n=1 Tax=Lysobacter dokdonensis DS-58 TaxID=1300345 RepID=A0A0A2WNF9_9GAMM|nr:glycerophosphodiester phosphodiesterase [Lysobacter dokdonensis]KGQ20267.1 Glycerophosphoryl diester phosphodiesterase [Lysobacter dokdonensis DS-58]